jgi:hypothetical protein
MTEEQIVTWVWLSITIIIWAVGIWWSLHEENDKKVEDCLDWLFLIGLLWPMVLMLEACAAMAWAVEKLFLLPRKLYKRIKK